MTLIIPSRKCGKAQLAAEPTASLSRQWCHLYGRSGNHELHVVSRVNQTQAGGRAVILFSSALLTGFLGWRSVARFGGAGSAVPITGFANTVVAPAMEFSREGYVLGMSAQLFTISGPVLVYGVLSAVISAGIKHLFGF